MAVQETIDTEKGDGVVKKAESFSWGNAVHLQGESLWKECRR